MPSTRIAVKRSASSSVSRPAASHVYAQFAAESTRSAAAPVQIGTELTGGHSVREERAESLLVAAPLAEDYLPVLPVEVAPLRVKTVATSSWAATTPRCPRSASRIRSIAGASSGTASSAA